jgi:glutathione S-transferase
MCLLHMSGQEWQPEYMGNPSKMPYGRLPVLRAGDRLIPDSSNIQAHLESMGADFNAGLSADEKARSHALIRMVEENLRCGAVYDRWLDDACWPHTRDMLFGAMPALLRRIIPGKIRKHVRRSMIAQGIAQFSAKDRLDRLGRDINAIEQTLDDKPFLFGKTPTAADAATVPVLDMIRTLPCDTGLRRLVTGNAKLTSYIERTRALIYPT